MQSSPKRNRYFISVLPFKLRAPAIWHDNFPVFLVYVSNGASQHTVHVLSQVDFVPLYRPFLSCILLLILGPFISRDCAAYLHPSEPREAQRIIDAVINEKPPPGFLKTKLCGLDVSMNLRRCDTSLFRLCAPQSFCTRTVSPRMMR